MVRPCSESVQGVMRYEMLDVIWSNQMLTAQLALCAVQNAIRYPYSDLDACIRDWTFFNETDLHPATFRSLI